MRYAAVFASLMVFWPAMALMGGQGFAALIGLTGLAALLMARPQWPLNAYSYFLGAFLLWCGATELWSPAGGEIISGNLRDGTFSVEMLGLSMVLTFLMGGLTVAGVMRAPDGQTGRSARWILLCLALHGLALAAMSVPQISEPIFAEIYGSAAEAASSGYQNIGRAANAFSLVVPLLAAYVGLRPGMFWKAVAALIYVAAFAVFFVLEFSTPIVGLLIGLFAIGVVSVLKTSGFRWILSALGAYISATPVLYGIGISLLREKVQYLPYSFQSRLRAWEVEIERTMDNPIIGNGIGASRLWKETFSSRPEWMVHLPPEFETFQIVPGHPHNMALHIWAETGVVGSILAGLTLVVLAFRLPAPREMRGDIRWAVAGLIGAVTSIFSFSYSVWNEGFWASVFLAAAAIIVVAKRERQSI